MKVGDKIRGFKFEGIYDNDTQVIQYINSMNKYIDKVGIIRKINSEIIAVDFEGLDFFLFYPKDQAEQHLVKDDKPIQYQIGIDTFQRAEANMTKEEILACVKFSIDKYNWRKKGQDKEDFKKIIDYANWGLKQLEDE